MQQRQRDIRDYAILATVRRIRARALHDRLDEARTEHERSLQRQAAAEAALQSCLDHRDDYAKKLRDRTSAGRHVRLDDLDGARSHASSLARDCERAEADIATASQAVGRALEACDAARREIAINEARVASLDEQVVGWKRSESVAAEDREEDERGDGARAPGR